MKFGERLIKAAKEAVMISNPIAFHTERKELLHEALHRTLYVFVARGIIESGANITYSEGCINIPVKRADHFPWEELLAGGIKAPETPAP